MEILGVGRVRAVVVKRRELLALRPADKIEKEVAVALGLCTAGMVVVCPPDPRMGL